MKRLRIIISIVVLVVITIILSVYLPTGVDGKADKGPSHEGSSSTVHDKRRGTHEGSDEGTLPPGAREGYSFSSSGKAIADDHGLRDQASNLYVESSESAFRYLKDLNDHAKQSQAACGIIRNMSIQDYIAHYDKFKNLDQGILTKAVCSLADAASREDLKSLIAIVENESNRVYFANNLANCYDRNAQGYMEFCKELRNIKNKNDRLVSSAVKQYFDDDFPLQNLAEIRSGSYTAAEKAQAIQLAALASFEHPGQSYPTILDELQKNGGTEALPAVSVMIKGWLDTNVDMTARWIMRQNSGAFKDAALVSLIDYLNRPEEAGQRGILIEQLYDSKLKERYQEALNHE